MMKYLKAPGAVMSADMAWHKNNGTTGEDFVTGGKMTTTTQMTKPCSDFKYIGDEWFNDGTYKQFFHGVMNGYKFSVLTCHCDDYVTVGDNYAGSTGLHLHHTYFHGHQSIDYMQANRNTKGVTQAEVDAKCVPQSTSSTKAGFRLNRSSTQSYPGNYDFDEDQRQHFDSNYDIKDGHTAVDRQGTTWLEDTAFTFVCNLCGSAPKEVRGYSFNECWGYHPNTGDLCWFDIELYGSTQDDICFELSNLTKNSDGTYTLKSAEDSYAKGTKFRKIKTTFYK